MREFALPALYAALLWWFTTGAILYLDGLAVRTFRWSMAGATVVLGAALFKMASSDTEATTAGAYAAFSCAILVWGWLEMSFLMGFITGPRTVGCSAGCRGWRHFLHATQAIIYNELMTLFAAAAILVITWHAPNRLSLYTFLVLWVMRISAKLNLFFGVPNLGEKFLPSHLQYLKTFFRKRAMNFLFPLSITGSTVTFALLVEKYLDAATPVQSVSMALLASLLGLAVLEHWFMVLPLPSEKLWNWALRTERPEPVIEDDNIQRQLTG